MKNTKDTKVGKKYLNMVTGMEVTVAAVEDGKVVFDDGTVVTREQLDCFRFTGYEGPAPIPQAKMTNGDHLVVDGEAVETGSLRVQAVLAAFHGGLVLSVLPKDAKDEDAKDGTEVWRYDAVNDSFKRIVGSTSTKVLYTDPEKGLCVMVGTETSQHKVGDDDNAVEEGMQENLYVIVNGKTVATARSTEHTVGELVLARQAGERAEMLVFASHRVLVPKVDVNGNEYTVAENGDQTFVTNLVVTRSDVYDDDLGDVVHVVDRYDTKVNGDLVAVQPVNDNRHSLFVIGTKEAVYTNNGYCARRIRDDAALAAARKHPYLVKFDPGTRENGFVMANARYETVTITVTKTDDRGFVTTVK